MSYFDEASLVMIPSGYKEDKIYSIKPTDGSGDLTFSRSNDTATRVNSDGLIEKVRTNVALYSEDFTQTNWDKTGVSITANTIANPINGATTADTLTATAGNTLHFLYDDAAPFSAGENTISIYAKYINNQWICLQWYDGSASAEASFDIQNGVVGAVDAGASSSITSIGSGWYRLSLTKTSTSGGTGYYVIGLNNSDAATLQVWNATGSETAYIFGAQLETGVLTDYIATTSAAVSVGPVANLPRLDYLGSSCPKLLLEPQRTNLATFSEQINQWSQERTSVTDNAITSPSGYVDADKVITDSTPDNTHQVYNGPFTNTAGNVAFSGFFKKGEYDYVHFGAGSANSKTWFNLNTGAVGSHSSDVVSASIEAHPNGWYRCVAIVNLATTSNYVEFGPASVDGSRTISGTPSGGIYCWGIQMENASSYATSYIPTLSAASTRGADAASKTGISSLIGQTEGTIFWEVQIDTPVATANEAILNIDAGAFGNTIYISKSATGNITGEMYVSSAAQASFTLSGISSGNYKIAFAYAQNNTAMFVNGVQVGSTDTSCNVPAMSRIQLGNGALGPSTDKTKQALLFPTRLTNAEAIALTTL